MSNHRSSGHRTNRPPEESERGLTPAQEAAEIIDAAESVYRWESERAAEACDLKALTDVVKAILQVLTPEQRKQVLDKI